MTELCCKSDHDRRSAMRKQDLTGLDWLEVDPTQTKLRVGFIGHVADWLLAQQIRIAGGQRERDIQVIDVRFERAGADDLDDVMVVTVDRPGDYSTYRLEVLDLGENGRFTGRTPPGFDSRYTSVEFTFKADCPTDLDPAHGAECVEAETSPVAAISYLAKDYQGFRQLMLDRMALTAPGWTERHAPDLGITLIELLAYAADDLSYYQDAVATEAYLSTARLRRSIRRHVRLVDYTLDEGQSAEGWVHLNLVGADTHELDTGDLMFTTQLPSEPSAMVKEADVRITQDVIVFEPQVIEKMTLRAAHNEIDFYDWANTECCLPRGATRATLRDPGIPPRAHGPATRERSSEEHENDWPTYDDPLAEIAEGRWHKLRLAPGDVLIFVERLGPRTGAKADADRRKRHAVRLTEVDYGRDPLTGTLVIEIAWCPEDALPFPLCLSTRTEPPACALIERVTVALGNVIAVDHGRLVTEDLGRVTSKRVDATCAEPCVPAEISIVAGKFRPRLALGRPALVAVSHGAVQAGCGGCGTRAANGRRTNDPSTSSPAIALTSTIAASADDQSYPWFHQFDLLESSPFDRHFVVEMEENGGATLRFGDGVHGYQPEAGARFTAHYRVGGGIRGNVGPGSIRHILFKNAYPDGIEIVASNPLPMLGGRDPETMQSAKLRAPGHFRHKLERAVAADDYAAIVMRDFPAVVQRAVATMRSSGVRTEVQIAIDPWHSSDPTSQLLECIENHLHRYRRIDHDVRVVAAQYVPIDLKIEVCVDHDTVAQDVSARIMERLLSAPGALFAPDAITFGQDIAVSQIIASVHSVEGVAHVTVTRLQRLYEAPNGEIEAGVMHLAPAEIARLDQDPSAPENGSLTLSVKGGR